MMFSFLTPFLIGLGLGGLINLHGFFLLLENSYPINSENIKNTIPVVLLFLFSLVFSTIVIGGALYLFVF